MAFNNLQQGRRRLLFWQEELLNEFCQSQGLVLDIGFDALEPLFGDICPVHRVPLERARVPVVHKGRWAPPLDVIEARRERFPFANFVVEGGCVVVAGEEDYAETSYCDRCRVELIEWNRGRKEPYGLPPEDFD